MGPWDLPQVLHSLLLFDGLLMALTLDLDPCGFRNAKSLLKMCCLSSSLYSRFSELRLVSICPFMALSALLIPFRMCAAMST